MPHGGGETRYLSGSTERVQEEELKQQQNRNRNRRVYRVVGKENRELGEGSRPASPGHTPHQGPPRFVHTHTPHRAAGHVDGPRHCPSDEAQEGSANDHWPMRHRKQSPGRSLWGVTEVRP